jgi:hypothetical protein
LRVFDLLLRILGAVFSVLMAVGSAVLEATATPGFWVYPVASAIAGNAFLVWFALFTMQKSWAPWIPGVAWIGLMLLLVAGTTEGDQIANSGTGLATFAAGALTFFAVTTILSRPEGRPAQS